MRDVVREYALDTLSEPDATLVIDETGFLKQGILRCRTPVHRLGGQDHQLPDRRLRRLCLVEGACFHRSAALPAQGLDGQSGLPRQSPRTGGGALRHQAGHCCRHGMPSDRRWRALRLAGSRQRLWRRQGGDVTAPGRKGLCARRHWRSSLYLLEPHTVSIRHRPGDCCSTAGGKLGPLVGGRWQQGAAAL